MTREELIATVSKITDLRAEVAKLSGLQKELRRLEALVDEITGTPATEPRGRGKDSIESRVDRFLKENNARDWSAEEVAGMLGTKVPTTRAAFSKLRKAGKIADTARGRVQATHDWAEENVTNRAA
jgi:hypothetical protein